MPLKHATETILVFTLGVLIVLAGFITAILPNLPLGALPWAVAFVFSLIYPLALYPLLKRTRADYAFRLLQYVPSFILVLWLLLQFLLFYVPSMRFLLDSFTWGWTLPAVLIAFLALIIFCLQVIRQRLPRIALLALLLVPFVTFSVLGEWNRWDDRLMATLWPVSSTGSGTIIGSVSSSSTRSSVVSSSSRSAAASSVAQSSSRSGTGTVLTWRERFNRFLFGTPVSSSSSVRSRSSSSTMIAVTSQPRSSRAASSIRSSVAASSVRSSISSASSARSSSSSRSSVMLSSSSSSTPPHLPTSGFGLGEVALLLAAGYTATLHHRYRKNRAVEL